MSFWQKKKSNAVGITEMRELWWIIFTHLLCASAKMASFLCSLPILYVWLSKKERIIKRIPGGGGGVLRGYLRVASEGISGCILGWIFPEAHSGGQVWESSLGGISWCTWWFSTRHIWESSPGLFGCRFCNECWCSGGGTPGCSGTEESSPFGEHLIVNYFVYNSCKSYPRGILGGHLYIVRHRRRGAIDRVHFKSKVYQ